MSEVRLPIKLCKLMLSKLSDHTMRARDWEKLCYRDFHAEVDFGHDKFYHLLPRLLKVNYIEKVSRGVYHMTEKGKKQLEVWNMEEKE